MTPEQLVPLDPVPVATAAGIAGIDRDTLVNLGRIGRELRVQTVRGRLVVDRADLQRFVDYRNYSIVTLNRQDYLDCLTFAVTQFYEGGARADFGTSESRDVGKYLSNHIQGKLGEVAVRKFLREKFDIGVELDFRVHGNVISQDITQIARRPGVWNNANVKVSVKSTKAGNCYLLVPEREVQLADRHSDYYVLVRVGLPADHIVRVFRAHPDLDGVRERIPMFADITCQVSGYCAVENLEGPIRELDGQPLRTANYMKRAGECARDWDAFQRLL